MLSKSKAQKARLQNLANGKERLDKIHKESAQSPLNPLQFVYSILIYGLTYKSVSLCFLQNNINPPSHSTYYRYVDIVIEKIIEMARECTEFWKSVVSPNTILIFCLRME